MLGSSERRQATTSPAVPPPTMTKSYWMDAMVALMRFLFNCVGNLEALLGKRLFSCQFDATEIWHDDEAKEAYPAH